MKKLIISIYFGLACSASVSAQNATDHHSFECDFSAMISQKPQRFSATSPVQIRFFKTGHELSEIHVIDEGGILFPGGNMKIVKTEEVTKLESVDFPSERPGTWNGEIESSNYKFRLASGEESDVVSFILTTEPRNDDNQHIVIWNARNQPEGLPQPITGTGVGYCVSSQIDKADQQ